VGEVNYAELQERFGGRYVARREADVLASAESDAELNQLLEEALTDWRGVVTEYVEPIDAIRFY
jgi:hypothetical protein